VGLVKITAMHWLPHRRRLAIPITTAREIVTERRVLIVRLTSDNGFSGYGEAAPLPGLSYETIEQVETELARNSDRLVGLDILSSWSEMERSISANLPDISPSLRFALETAAWDLAAQSTRQPLCQWLNCRSDRIVSVNYLLDRPVEDWEVLRNRLVEGGFRAIKVKVGRQSEDGDVELVRRLRAELGNDIAVRLDANRAWNYDQALRILGRMHTFGIEYVEEPLAGFEPAFLKRLFRLTGVPCALDETVRDLTDLETHLADRICQVVILKPTILGGLARTLRLAETARRHQIPVVVTSCFESETGMAALLHLAAAIPGERLSCGLDTLRYFAEPQLPFAAISNGAAGIPYVPGLGYAPKDWPII
jgi:O-succinylbenzoate synthase